MSIDGSGRLNRDKPELVLWKATKNYWPAKILQRGAQKTSILVLGKDTKKEVNNKDLHEFVQSDNFIPGASLRAAYRAANALLN